MIPHRGKRTHTYEGKFLEQIFDNIDNNWNHLWDVKMIKTFHMTLMNITDMSELFSHWGFTHLSNVNMSVLN